MFDLSDPKTNALGYLFQEWEECACRSILAASGSVEDFYWLRDGVTPGGMPFDALDRYAGIIEANRTVSRQARSHLFEGKGEEPQTNLCEQVAGGADLPLVLPAHNLGRALQGQPPLLLPDRSAPWIDELRGSGDEQAVAGALASLKVGRL